MNKEPKKPRRPNIVFIQTESQDGRLLGLMGHPALEGSTPNLDKLAEQGVVFENNYCNFPLCCPSRASMWSGRFPHKIRAWNNYNGIDPDTPTFVSRLVQNGYQAKICGRTDHVSGAHGIGARVGSWTRAAAIPRQLHGEAKPPEIIENGGRRVHSNDWGHVDQACEFLHNKASENSPFLLYLGLHNAHHPFATSSYYLNKVPEDKVRIPPNDTLDHPLLPLQRLQKGWNHALSPADKRLRRRIYQAMIVEVDAMIGTLLKALEDGGFSENTWVVFTSDHGEMAGEHDQYIKLTHFEGSMRVPLIIRGPEAQKDVRITTPSSLVDLHPTLLELGQVDVPAECDGHSLLPEATGQATGRPPRVFAEHHSTTCPTGSFMLRRGDWKYIAYPGYEPLLFNITEDPDELQNRAPAHPDQVHKLSSELKDIVDIEAVDRAAKEEDRRCFSDWRREALNRGVYEKTMSQVYSGKLGASDPKPWRDENEQRVRQWLDGNPLPLPEIRCNIRGHL